MSPLDWFKKESPLLGLIGLGGGSTGSSFAGGGAAEAEVNIYVWGSEGGGGRGGAPGGAGWASVTGTCVPGTVLSYVVGTPGNGANFYYGGGNGNNSGGGFSAVFVGPGGPGARPACLACAGGSGAGGYDHYGTSIGG